MYVGTESPRILCVFVSQGKGVPDVNSRLMVKKLWDTLQIPIFALVDADPHGMNHWKANQLKSPTYFAKFSLSISFLSSLYTQLG